MSQPFLSIILELNSPCRRNRDHGRPASADADTAPRPPGLQPAGRRDAAVPTSGHSAHRYHLSRRQRPAHNAADLIAGIGSQLTGGRWTPPGTFRALYASREEATALDESRQQNLRLGVPPWMALPLVVTALEVDLHPALDFTDGRVRRTLQISRDRMLAEPWWSLQDQGREALTQALGRLAREHGVVALLVPSAARPRGTNVVIYPDRITANDHLAIVNPERLPPGTDWRTADLPARLLYGPAEMI